MQTLTISVLLPTNRLDRFFDIALRSVGADLPFGSEVLVILNGEAIDQSNGIDWASFKIQNLRILRSFEAGIVAALNLGLREAQGEFIARMDGDDEVLPGRFLGQLEFLRKNTDFSAIGAQFVEVCQHGMVGARSHLPRRLRVKPWPPMTTRIAHPAVMFRRASALSVGGYRSDFHHAEDQDLWLRLLKISQLGNLPQVYLKYRKHSQQVSVENSNQQQLGLIQTYLWNAGLGSCEGLLFEALVAADYLKLIRGSHAIGLKTKCMLYGAVNYWSFSSKVGSSTKKFLENCWKHPLISLLFIWANRRSLLKAASASGTCEECAA